VSTPLPIDVSGIDQPLPDLGHEAIRQAVLAAMSTVWTQHQTLADRVTTLESQVAALITPPTP
jgi:hypothetical protein